MLLIVDYVSSRHKSRSNSMLAMSRGRSWSNVSLSTAPSMSSVREEAAYHTMSTTSLANDPLADATYIRANYSYIPHHPKELAVEPGYVFHIFEDGPPERHRRSFWVSRLNKDGSDAGVGAIPNTVRCVCVCVCVHACCVCVVCVWNVCGMCFICFRSFIQYIVSVCIELKSG